MNSLYLIFLHLLLAAVLSPIVGVKLSDLLKKQNNSLEIIYGTGHNKFVRPQSNPNVRHQISLGLIQELHERHVKLAMIQLSDDQVIAIPKHEPVEDDAPVSILMSSSVIEPGHTIPEVEFEKIKGKYLLIENSFGLGSRMRVLAGFKYVGQVHYKTNYIVMVWNNETKDLFGNFDDIYDPIPDVYFVRSKERSYYEKFALKSFKNSWIMFQANLAWHNIKVPDFPLLEQEYYSDLYIPIKAIRDEVIKFTAENGICEACSFHIRRTDLHDAGRTEDDQFDSAITHCVGRKIFISTDNPDSRKRYQEKFPGRVLYYGTMPTELQHNSFRYTDLRQSLTEALIASRADKYMGTILSSWSEAIDSFHRHCKVLDCCRHPETVW